MNRTVTRTRSSVIHEEGAVGIDVGEAIGPGPISVGKIRPPPADRPHVLPGFQAISRLYATRLLTHA